MGNSARSSPYTESKFPARSDSGDGETKPRRCLRCRDQKKGCSGGCPCERCEAIGIGADGCVKDSDYAARKNGKRVSGLIKALPKESRKLKGPRKSASCAAEVPDDSWSDGDGSSEYDNVRGPGPHLPQNGPGQDFYAETDIIAESNLQDAPYDPTGRATSLGWRIVEGPRSVHRTRPAGYGTVQGVPFVQSRELSLWAGDRVTNEEALQRAKEDFRHEYGDPSDLYPNHEWH